MIAYIEIIARWVRDCLEPIMYIPFQFHCGLLQRLHKFIES